MVHLALVAVWALSSQPQQTSSAKTAESKRPPYSEMFDPFVEKKPETPEQEADRARRNTVVIWQPAAGVNSRSLGEAARELRDQPCGKQE
jgi:hypothetical protein